VKPVLEDAACHSIHAYFNTSPESPDGRYVLLFRSTAPDAHEGEVCVLDRGTGSVTVLAQRVTTEDAHRAACQQWTQGGRDVVFHDVRDGRWVVAAAEVASGRQRVLAEGRQLGWGQPGGETVTLYGPHWNPGEYRNLELLNVRTGEIKTVLTADELRAAHGEWVQQQFGDRPVSIFFPILSPDQQRVFFKLAAPDGGGFRSPTGSRRLGLFCFDLAQRKFLPMYASWGHPAWHPDSRHVLNVWSQRLVKIDTTSGDVQRQANLPAVPGAHPSFSPDGRLFVADVMLEAGSDGRSPWGVLVGDFQAGETALVHRFDNTRGAASWRRSHPHPVFSPDGRRIYFNVSADAWTRLYVAEL
jgi:Tol biopolymer transport system component